MQRLQDTTPILPAKESRLPSIHAGPVIDRGFAGLPVPSFAEVVRDVAGDLAEEVQLVDEFVHPKHGQINSGSSLTRYRDAFYHESLCTYVCGVCIPVSLLMHDFWVFLLPVLQAGHHIATVSFTDRWIGRLACLVCQRV